MRKKYKKVQYLTLQDKFRVLFTVHILQDCLEAIDLGKESEFKKILTLIATFWFHSQNLLQSFRIR